MALGKELIVVGGPNGAVKTILFPASGGAIPMSDNGKNRHVSLEVFERAAELIRIGRRAVAQAQAESRAKGIPNVYSINGVLYYELSNGELTREEPEIYKRATEKHES